MTRRKTFILILGIISLVFSCVGSLLLSLTNHPVIEAMAFGATFISVAFTIFSFLRGVK